MASKPIGSETIAFSNYPNLLEGEAYRSANILKYLTYTIEMQKMMKFSRGILYDYHMSGPPIGLLCLAKSQIECAKLLILASLNKSQSPSKRGLQKEPYLYHRI